MCVTLSTHPLTHLLALALLEVFSFDKVLDRVDEERCAHRTYRFNLMSGHGHADTIVAHYG
jgi:hypothetical protein